MSAHAAAQSVVSAQQDYARAASLARLFEDLTTALIIARPADAAAFVAEEAARMGAAAAAGAPYRATPVNAALDTEEAAAAYMEEHRVRPMLEELFAALLVAKPADACAFLRDEARKVQALRAEKKPVRGEGREGGGGGERRRTRARAATPSLTHPLPPARAHPPARQSALFSDDDLLGMFSLFDPVSNNFITADQARTALRNLGIRDLSAVPEAPLARVDSKAFLALARAALDRERLV